MSRQKPNLKKLIKDLKGDDIPMSFPTKSDVEKIKNEKKLKDVKDVLVDDLPKETIQNVIINCLSHYEPTDKKEVFLINNIATWALSDPDKDGNFGELKDKLYNFLVDDVLDFATIYREVELKNHKREETEKKKNGLYPAFIMFQVYNELGITE